MASHICLCHGSRQWQKLSEKKKEVDIPSSGCSGDVDRTKLEVTSRGRYGEHR